MSDRQTEVRVNEIVEQLGRVVGRISALERAVALRGEVSGIAELRDDVATLGEEMATRGDLDELREAIGKCGFVLQARIREDIVHHLHPRATLEKPLGVHPIGRAGRWIASDRETSPTTRGD